MNGKFWHFNFSVLVLVLMTTSAFALKIRTLNGGDIPLFYDDYMTASSVSHYTWQQQQDNAGYRTDSDPDGAAWVTSEVNTWDVQVIDDSTSPDPGSYLNTNYLRVTRSGGTNTGIRANFTRYTTNVMHIEFMAYVKSGQDCSMGVVPNDDNDVYANTTPRTIILTRYNGSTYYLDRWNGSSYVNIRDEGNNLITYTPNTWQKWVIDANLVGQTVSVKIASGNTSTSFPFCTAGSGMKGVSFISANYPTTFYLDAVAEYAEMDITWTTVANHPTYRKAGVMGTFEGAPHSIAGCQYPWSESADSYSYETNNTWIDRLDLPVGRAYTQGIGLSNSYIYVCGGRNSSTNKAECYKYWRDGTLKWTQISSLGTAASLHAIGNVGTRIIVAGGYNWATDGYLNETQYYDTSYPNNGWQYWDDVPDGSYQGSPLVGRYGPAGCGVGSEFYFFGGTRLYTSGQTTTYVRMPESHVLNTSTGHWSDINDLPVGRSNAATVPYKDRYIFIMGGCRMGLDPNGGWYAPDVLVYDTVYDNYKTLPSSLPYATGDIRASVSGFDGCIYAVGGENVDAGHSNTDNHTRKGTIVYRQPTVY